MKKVLKIVGIVVLILIVLGAIGIFTLGKKAEERSKQYYNYANTGGEIEKKYTAMGDKAVSYREYDAGDPVIGKYAVWYPSELESLDRVYPVVVWANGTGSKSATYEAFLTHLASWGFIAVGNDDENTRSGASLNAAIEFLMAENERANSIFYHKLDLDRVGVGGHSQGGPAVFNMVTNQERGDMIKAVYAVSATSSYHTGIYQDGWEYDISKVNVPTLLTAGTGTFDAGSATSKDQVNDDSKGIAQGICPLWSLEENFILLPDDIQKVIARKTGVDHGDSHLQCDGYMTAWFMYWLQGDTEAGTAFSGNSPEILNNPDWQDVKANMVIG